jgi:S1-C subfamily serine protease
MVPPFPAQSMVPAVGVRQDCWCGRAWQPGEAACPQCGRARVPWSTPGYSPPPEGWHGEQWGGPRSMPLPPPVVPPAPQRSRRWLVPALVALLVAVLVAPLVAGYRSATVTPDQVARELPRSLTAPTATATAQPLAEVAAASLSRVVTIETQTPDHQELGTGWLLDGKGDFVTNAHVVEGALSVRIRDRRNATHVGAIMGVDHDQDIAVVRSLDGFDARPLAMSAGTDPPVPSDVIVLASGRATGHDDQTATVETIARLHQDVPVRGNTEIDPSNTTTVLYHDMIAMRGTQVYPGNSGGPVMNAFAEVIGIVTLASRSTPQAYAIPVGRVSAELFDFAGRPTP